MYYIYSVKEIYRIEKIGSQSLIHLTGNLSIIFKECNNEKIDGTWDVIFRRFFLIDLVFEVFYFD